MYRCLFDSDSLTEMRLCCMRWYQDQDLTHAPSIAFFVPVWLRSCLHRRMAPVAFGASPVGRPQSCQGLVLASLATR